MAAIRRFVLLLSISFVASTASGCLPVVAAAIFGVLEVTENNQAPPSVLIKEIERDGAATTAHFHVVVVHPDGAEVELEGFYRINGGTWQPATLVPDRVAGSAGGVQAAIDWQAAADLGSGAYRDGVELRLVPRVGSKVGAPQVSNVFAFGNDAPRVTSLAVDVDGQGVVGGVAIVRFTVQDHEDLVGVSGFEYSLAGDFSDTQPVPITTGLGSYFPVGTASGLPSSLQGIEHSIGWNSLGFELAYSPTARIRLRLTDEYGAQGPWFESSSFTLDNQTPPALRFLRVKEISSSGLRSGAVEIVVRVEDDERDVVDVAFEFSPDGGLSWFPCTEYRAPISAGPVDLASETTQAGGIEHVFWWDAGADVFAQQPSVLLRARGHDGWKLGAAYEFAVPMTVGPSVDAQPFAMAQSVNLPYPGHFVTTADFNGDGFDDVAVLHAGDNRVSIHAGRADGLPTLLATHQVSGLALGAVAADVTGNGHVDLVVRTDQNLHVLSGNGAGGFSLGPAIAAPALSYALATIRPCIAVADFDGTNGPDLAVTDPSNSRVVVYANNGSGGFSVMEALEVEGANPNGLGAADVTGNGHADIVVQAWDTPYQNTVADTVQVFEGNGDGTFEAPTLLAPGPWLWDTVLGDFDGDGRPDIASLSFVGSVHLWLSNGDGTYREPAAAALLNAQTPMHLRAGDITGNGVDDLLAFSDDRLAYRGSLGQDEAGMAGFLQPVTLATSVHMAALGDVNGDGRTDIVHTVAGTTDLSVRQASGGHAPLESPAYSFLISSAQAMAIGDATNTGTLDMVVAAAHSSSEFDLVDVFYGRGRHGIGTGSFGAVATYAIGKGVPAIAMLDVDNDGWLDIVALSTNDDAVSVLRNSGAGGFLPYTSHSTPAGPLAFAAGDLTGDGYVDLVVACSSTLGVTVLQNDQNGGFSAQSTYPLAALPIDVALADVNGDGRLDLVCAIDASPAVIVRLGDGTGGFGPAAAVPLSAGVTNIRLCDLTGNGVLDLVGFNRFNSPTVRLFAGNESATVPGTGTGTFTAQATVTAMDYIRDVALGDFNHDGRPDLVISGLDAAGRAWLEIHTNDGPFSFAAPSGDANPFAVNPGSLRVADFNRDGLLDVAWVEMGYPYAAISHGTMPVQHRYSMMRELTAADVLGADVLVRGTDRFGRPASNQLAYRRYVGAFDAGPVPPAAAHQPPHASFRDLLRAAQTSGQVNGLPAGLSPITDAWVVSGERRLDRVADPSLFAEPRLRVSQRFGQPLAAGTHFEREGLDMSSTSSTAQRALIVEVPIREEIDNAEIAAAQSVHVALRISDWRRASEFAADPLFGHAAADAYLPWVPTGPLGSELFVPRWEWMAVPRDPDDNLVTANGMSGPRFVVDTTVSPRVVRIATDRFGTFQAYIRR